MVSRNIQLLSDIEIEHLYALPNFDHYERNLYFELTEEERQLAQQFATTRTKIYFILQIGYFKAKHLFFKFTFDQAINDVRYIHEKYCLGEMPVQGKITRERISFQRSLIKQCFEYKDCNKEILDELRYQLSQTLKTHPKPRNATHQLITYCNVQQILLPTYRTLQDIYSYAYNIVNTKVSDIFNTITDEQKKALDDLLSSDENIISLNTIRYDQIDFSYTEVKNEVIKVNQLADIYHLSKQICRTIGLSQNAIQYYAREVEQYPPARLRKMSEAQQYLRITCYIHQRYQLFLDNLIASYLHHFKLLESSSKSHAETEYQLQAIKVIKKYPKLSQFFRWFPSQEDSYQSLSDFYNDAYNIIEKSDFSYFAKFFDDSNFDIKASKWQYIEDNHHAISLYLRPITLSLELEHYLPNHPIIELMAILKNHYLSGKNPGKLKLSDDIGLNLPSAIVPYLKADPKDQYLNPYRFEFYVYTKVYHHLDRGRMFCNDSLTYRDIDQDLITTNMIKQATIVCQKHGYDKVLTYADKYLEDKIKELDDTWAIVNRNISSGNNTGIEILDTNNGVNWQLTYDTSEKLDDSFFKKLPKVDIATIFHFINEQFDLYSVFEHIKGKYVKQTKPTALAITACILSEAFGFGINKMAEISDMNANTLYATRENFIRLETLQSANDNIANHIEKLPIFHAWNLLDEKLLADIDGQKASTKANTIKSRYSRKYLGKGKGLSVLSLIANFMAIAVKNIGLNEYEGHHLFDMIYDNQSNVKIDALTGDNHTLNQLNTIVLDAINVDFVPSIKNIKSETANLYYGLTHNEGNRLFKPAGQIKLERIHRYSNDISRVLLSLIMQDNTQAIIIRKLNSHSRYAGLRSALVEYNKIFNSIHVLNLINNSQLRKAIRTARNRTESYHQLQKLIRRLYYGVFKGKRIVDQDISTQAVRLVSNIIVAYNSIILNELYEGLVSNNASKKDIEKFLRISPMAWIHIALTGKYTFNGKDHNIDLKEIIKLLESELKSFTGANY